MLPPELQTSPVTSTSQIVGIHPNLSKKKKKKSSKSAMSQHLLLLLRPSPRQVYLVGLSLAGTTTLFTTIRHHQRQQVLLCESSSSSSSSSSWSTLSQPLQKNPQPRQGREREGKAIIWKEISSGSILGQFWFSCFFPFLWIRGRGCGEGRDEIIKI